MTGTETQTIPKQNQHLITRWFDEVWTEGRRETISELYAADGILHDGSKTLRGRDEFLAFYDALRAEFSTFHVTCFPVLAEGDKASARWSVECTHKSGKSVHLTGMAIVQIRNGQFIKAWQNYDEAGIAAQLS